MASTARYKRLGKLTWIEKMISSSRSLTLYIPFFDQLQKKFQVFSRFLVERALKICKKILKIWKKSVSRVNTWGIQKKRPKKSWTSKKIQTHEFVGKNNKKNASGGLRPPSGGPSGHLGGLATPWSDVTFQILRPCNNQSYTPTPIFSEI